MWISASVIAASFLLALTHGFERSFSIAELVGAEHQNRSSPFARAAAGPM